MYNSLIKYILSTLVSLSERKKNKELIKWFYLNYQSIFLLKWQGKYWIQQILWKRVDSLEKTLMAGRDWGQEEKGTTEDEMAGWHHWLNGRESEWTPGVGDGQGGLACCHSCGRKESDTTERLNWTEIHFDLK